MAYNLSSEELSRIQRATPEQYAQAYSLILRGKAGAVRGDSVLSPLVNAMVGLGLKSAEQLRRERSEWEIQEELPPKKLDIKTGTAYVETPYVETPSGGMSQVSAQVVKQQQEQKKIYEIVPYSPNLTRKQNFQRITANILKRQIQRRKAEFEGLKKGYDFVSGGRLTEKNIQKTQFNLNKEIEDYNKSYNEPIYIGVKKGVKTYKPRELSPQEYGKAQAEYLTLERKQQEIDNRESKLRKSFKGKLGDFLYTGDNFSRRTREQSSKEINSVTKDLTKTLAKINKLETKGGFLSKARIKVLNKLVVSELNEIEDIKNLTPRKIAIGYVSILPAGLGTPTGLKGIKYGLRDLYGIRLKGTKQLTSDIKSYYLKPSKAKLTKIKATQKRLRAFDNKIKTIKRASRIVKRKDLKYLGKTLNIKVYSMKKAPLSTRIKGKIKGLSLKKLKLKALKVRKVSRKDVNYIGRIGKAKIYQRKPKSFFKGKIITHRTKAKVPAKKTNYRYIARIGKARIYQKIKVKPKGRIPSGNKFGLIGKKPVKGNYKYKYLGRKDGIKVFKKVKVPKAKEFKGKIGSSPTSGHIYKDRGGYYFKEKTKTGIFKKYLGNKVKRYYFNSKGQVVPYEEKQISLSIRISKADVRKLVNRTIKNMPLNKQKKFFNYLKQADKELNKLKLKQRNLAGIRQYQAQVNKFQKKYIAVNGQRLLSKARIVQLSVYKRILSELAILSLLFRLKKISREKFNQASKSALGLGQFIKQVPGQGGEQAQGQGQGLVQAQIQDYPVIVPQEYIQTGEGIPGKKRYVPYISLKLRKGRTAQGGKGTTGYVVYGKYKGKFLRLNKLPLTKQDALSRGSYAIDRTTSKMFKLAPVSRVEKFGLLQKRERGYYTKAGYKFREYVINKGKKYNVLLKKVEKRRYGIDTLGEKKGLTLARYLKRLKGGKY